MFWGEICSRLVGGYRFMKVLLLGVEFVEVRGALFCIIQFLTMVPLSSCVNYHIYLNLLWSDQMVKNLCYYNVQGFTNHRETRYVILQKWQFHKVKLQFSLGSKHLVYAPFFFFLASNFFQPAVIISGLDANKRASNEHWSWMPSVERIVVLNFTLVC